MTIIVEKSYRRDEKMEWSHEISGSYLLSRLMQSSFLNKFVMRQLWKLFNYKFFVKIIPESFPSFFVKHASSTYSISFKVE